MRVLLLCHGHPPDQVGGVEQHVEGLSRALASLGHTVHVLTRSDAPAVPQTAVVGTVAGNPAVTRIAWRWEGLRSLRDVYDSPGMAAALAAFLRDQRAAGATFDIAHVHHLTGMSVDSLRVLADAGVPTVLTLHDYWLMCPRGQMWHRHEVACERVDPGRCAECLQPTFPDWLAGAAAVDTLAALHARARELLALPGAVVVPSARAMPPFQALGIDTSRWHVVENGVDTGALERLPLPACGPGPLRLGYLGTVIPSKGLHVLLAALRRLPDRTVALEVHGNAVPYHGDHGYLTRCFGMLRPGDPVAYRGPYATADLPRILDGIDVVCAPALWHEAFGLTVREGLAAGRPVLVSRIGGLQDAVVDGVEGRLLPPGDAEAWAAAILELAQDRPRVRAMAGRARPRARGFEAMARGLLEVYGTVRRARPASA
jgi:glycosyltransferase involved in cell wall biosynthesis